MAKRKTRPKAPPLRQMGGKEERISKVGAARARVERAEERGGTRFDEAPGPSAARLLQPAKGKRAAKPNQRVSRKRRAGPSELEPDIKLPPPEEQLHP